MSMSLEERVKDTEFENRVPLPKSVVSALSRS